MCFLKTLKPLDQISIEKQTNYVGQSQPDKDELTSSEPSYLNQLLFSDKSMVLNKQDGLLMKMFDLIGQNNTFLQHISKKLQMNAEQINNCFQLMNSMEAQTQTPTVEQQQLTVVDRKDHHEQSSVDPLITKLFGKKKYDYKLQMKEAFPNIIYKERNFNISINLVNKKEEKILNSNIIHLCLGVCDSNGQWISQNKVGENFMKGKTEIQLYHGQGNFLKIYPRDVSRHYADGKLNFVIYSKPSTIKFSNNASNVEKIVQSISIEPFIIRGYTIKAKKID